MKGVILAGGTGSRLFPLTKVTNKHLLPVYNKPMIYYSLYALKRAGIDNILIISGKGHAGNFLELLGSGSELGVKLSYEVQGEAGGIAQALSLAEDFAAGGKIVVVLADNVIEDDLSEAVTHFVHQPRGAKIFLKNVKNPESYGIAEFSPDGRLSAIVEKPENPSSDCAVIGCYMYDSQVFDVIRPLKPSARNELEITDVNNFYLDQGTLHHAFLSGFWGDCGESFDSLVDACKLVQNSALADLDDRLSLDERKHRELCPEQQSKSVESPV